MPNAVIEDGDQFKAFLAAQPLCKWLAEKQNEIARDPQMGHRAASVIPPAPKSDNAELVAALSSMA
jgi:hypothetical protein